MKLLLDTCTFLWAAGKPGELSPSAREAIEDGNNELVLSQASAWEIQIKQQSGKLRLLGSPRAIVEEGLRLHGIAYQMIEDDFIWHLDKLPDHHRDPFDRLLIASALCGGMKIVSPDRQIHRYPVPVIW
ncbi:MAG TPA: type II toxin-antitoxin system VapC family toxin [Opitutales bacterium]|nr:type II toxin-antitoxin system VapC family toxin [Opitutales bacterium]